MVHDRAPVDRHGLPGRLVGVGRNRISEVFARHAVKRLAAGHGVRRVEIPQQLIERAVFHHQHHDVVKGCEIPPLVREAEQGTALRPWAWAVAPWAQGDRGSGEPDKRPTR